MTRILAAFVVAALLSTSAFAQDTTVRHRSGARRQLATIVFAGLGGAILGLSTLSFYGRPQDHLSNIAVGFAIGVIGGTAYVTIRSATSRDYYNDTPQTSSNLKPAPGIEPLAEAEIKNDFTTSVDDEPKFLWSPLIAKAAPESSVNSMGAQLLFKF